MPKSLIQCVCSSRVHVYSHQMCTAISYAAHQNLTTIWQPSLQSRDHMQNSTCPYTDAGVIAAAAVAAAARSDRLAGAISCYGIQNICIATSAAAAALLSYMREGQHHNTLSPPVGQACCQMCTKYIHAFKAHLVVWQQLEICLNYFHCLRTVLITSE